MANNEPQFSFKNLCFVLSGENQDLGLRLTNVGIDSPVARNMDP